MNTPFFPTGNIVCTFQDKAILERSGVFSKVSDANVRMDMHDILAKSVIITRVPNNTIFGVNLEFLTRKVANSKTLPDWFKKELMEIYELTKIAKASLAIPCVKFPKIDQKIMALVDDNSTIKAREILELCVACVNYYVPDHILREAFLMRINNSLIGSLDVDAICHSLGINTRFQFRICYKTRSYIYWNGKKEAISKHLYNFCTWQESQYEKMNESRKVGDFLLRDEKVEEGVNWPYRLFVNTLDYKGPIDLAQFMSRHFERMDHLTSFLNCKLDDMSNLGALDAWMLAPYRALKKGLLYYGQDCIIKNKQMEMIKGAKFVSREMDRLIVMEIGNKLYPIVIHHEDLLTQILRRKIKVIHQWPSYKSFLYYVKYHDIGNLDNDECSK